MSDWRPAAVSREEYLELCRDPSLVRSLAANPPGGGPNPNLLCFGSRGGLLGKGVCWWHSRFTRNALYLAWFRPEQRPPGTEAARSIVKTIMKAEGVVDVPGYSNLCDFSSDHQDAIQKTLERRQLFEGLVKFAWVDGLWGPSATTWDGLRREMVRIADVTSSLGLAYAKFQVPGLDAHAVLINGVEELDGGGFRACYLDSVSRREESFVLGPGDRQVELSSGMRGVPHLQRTGELQRLRCMMRKFAGEADVAPREEQE